jgi:hypothetical protein
VCSTVESTAVKVTSTPSGGQSTSTATPGTSTQACSPTDSGGLDSQIDVVVLDPRKHPTGLLHQRSMSTRASH